MIDDTINKYTASLDTELRALYGIRSRADDASDISQQVLNINRTISELAVQYLNPLQSVVDFKTTMLAFQDESNQTEVTGALHDDAVTGAGNTMDAGGTSSAALNAVSPSGASS